MSTYPPALVLLPPTPLERKARALRADVEAVHQLIGCQLVYRWPEAFDLPMLERLHARLTKQLAACELQIEDGCSS